MSERQPSFEKAMARLEEIVSRLEGGNIELEKSLTLFEEGTKLISLCNGLLDKAEKKVTLLSKTPDGDFVEIPFETEQADEV